MKQYGCQLIKTEDTYGSIDLKKMTERFEMDTDEKHGKMKALLFRIAYPIIKRLPADKTVFVCKFNN